MCVDTAANKIWHNFDADCAQSVWLGMRPLALKKESLSLEPKIGTYRNFALVHVPVLRV